MREEYVDGAVINALSGSDFRFANVNSKIRHNLQALYTYELSVRGDRPKE